MMEFLFGYLMGQQSIAPQKEPIKENISNISMFYCDEKKNISHLFVLEKNPDWARYFRCEKCDARFFGTEGTIFPFEGNFQ